MTLTMGQYGVIVMPEHKTYVKSESKVPGLMRDDKQSQYRQELIVQKNINRGLQKIILHSRLNLFRG